jgi:Cu(I)/Ag(I) efflux system membrane fusion protein
MAMRRTISRSGWLCLIVAGVGIAYVNFIRPSRAVEPSAGHGEHHHSGHPDGKQSNGDPSGGSDGKDEEEMDMPGMPGMKMPRGGAKAEPAKVPGYTIVAIAPERLQLIGVRIGKVERDRLVMAIRAVGIIEPDQTRLVRVQTRINGWVTKVFVNFLGQKVKEGEPLLEIYSPELVTTQQEYLIARPRQGATDSQRSLGLSNRRRLELWGVPADEIDELEKSGKVRDTLMLRSPIGGTVLERNLLQGSYIEPSDVLYKIADLSTVWLQAKIYENELPHVEVGQPVRVRLQSRPESEIEGRVKFIEPVVQEKTRTINVRVEIANPDDMLKPGMFADLEMTHDMGDGLLVPTSAVMRTGERSIAFRVLSEGKFEPVEVKLGGRFGDRFEILDGLAEGDQVVVSAGFLIDSESRLKATASGGGGGHKHGG